MKEDSDEFEGDSHITGGGTPIIEPDPDNF